MIRRDILDYSTIQKIHLFYASQTQPRPHFFDIILHYQHDENHNRKKFDQFLACLIVHLLRKNVFSFKIPRVPEYMMIPYFIHVLTEEKPSNYLPLYLNNVNQFHPCIDTALKKCLLDRHYFFNNLSRYDENEPPPREENHSILTLRHPLFAYYINENTASHQLVCHTIFKDGSRDFQTF